ncbi:MAG: ACT domain-containing protein [Blastocatellia bacterium]|nr:ACT domain-containing protein [Blastocatellia bacterium]
MNDREGTYSFTVSVLPEVLAVCRLTADAPLPAWAVGHSFFSCTRTPDEFSIVCPEAAVPPATRSETGWRALKIEAVLDFSMTGIVSSLTTPLAAAGISVFVLSTFDTDYVLVKAAHLEQTIRLWRELGHSIEL